MPSSTNDWFFSKKKNNTQNKIIIVNIFNRTPKVNVFVCILVSVVNRRIYIFSICFYIFFFFLLTFHRTILFDIQLDRTKSNVIFMLLIFHKIESLPTAIHLYECTQFSPSLFCECMREFERPNRLQSYLLNIFE